MTEARRAIEYKREELKARRAYLAEVLKDHGLGISQTRNQAVKAEIAAILQRNKARKGQA